MCMCVDVGLRRAHTCGRNFHGQKLFLPETSPRKPGVPAPELARALAFLLRRHRLVEHGGNGLRAQRPRPRENASHVARNGAVRITVSNRRSAARLHGHRGSLCPSPPPPRRLHEPGSPDPGSAHARPRSRHFLLPSLDPDTVSRPSPQVLPRPPRGIISPGDPDFQHAAGFMDEEVLLTLASPLKDESPPFPRSSSGNASLGRSGSFPLCFAVGPASLHDLYLSVESGLGRRLRPAQLLHFTCSHGHEFFICGHPLFIYLLLIFATELLWVR